MLNRIEQNRTEQLITICNITEHFMMNRLVSIKRKHFLSFRLNICCINTKKV